MKFHLRLTEHRLIKGSVMNCLHPASDFKVFNFRIGKGTIKKVLLIHRVNSLINQGSNLIFRKCAFPKPDYGFRNRQSFNLLLTQVSCDCGYHIAIDFRRNRNCQSLLSFPGFHPIDFRRSICVPLPLIGDSRSVLIGIGNLRFALRCSIPCLRPCS